MLPHSRLTHSGYACLGRVCLGDIWVEGKWRDTIRTHVVACLWKVSGMAYYRGVWGFRNRVRSGVTDRMCPWKSEAKRLPVVPAATLPRPSLFCVHFYSRDFFFIKHDQKCSSVSCFVLEPFVLGVALVRTSSPQDVLKKN